MNLPSINRTRALRATQAFLVAVGGTGMIACAATVQWWIAVIGAGWSLVTWFTIYKFLEKWERPV